MSESQLASPPNPIVDNALGKVGDIATLPEVTVKIIHIVEDVKSTARDLHDVIKNDPALSAKILKVVNSAFYGLPGQISSVDRAIVLLGLSAIKNISIAMSMTRMFRGGAQVEGIDGREVWRHSMAVGGAARLLTKLQGRPTVEEAFLAGLLHDLGLLVERQAFGPKLKEIVKRYNAAPKPFTDVETEVLGADHQAFGMGLATKWRFPRALKLAIGYHHKPLDLAAENRELPAIIHVADILACQTGIGFSLTAKIETISDDVLKVLELARDDVEPLAAQLTEQVSVAESVFNS